MISKIMKSILLVAVTALITYFITCHFCKPKQLVDIPDKDRSATICMDYENIQPATLTTDLVRSMVTKYDKTQLNYIQNAPGTQVSKDARAIWFDFETLKQFIYHIEYNVNKNFEVAHDKKLGIRIYYSAYPSAEEMNVFMSQQNDSTYQFDPAYQNLHTLVMIPTITGTDGQNFDFNPMDKTTYNGFTDKSARNLLLTPNYSTLSLGAASETTNLTNPNHTSARNHGTLYPPGNAVGFGF